MRLLFVHPFLSPFGGAQLALRWLLKGLAEKGHDIKICAASDPNHIQSQLTSSGIEVSIKKESDDPGIWIAEESKNFNLLIPGNYPSTLWVHGSLEIRPLPVVWNCYEPPRALYEDVMSEHFSGSAVDPKFQFPWSKRLKKKKVRKLAEADRQGVAAFDRIAAISRQTRDWIRTIYGREAQVVSLGVGDMQLSAQRFPADPFILFSPAGLEPIKNFSTVLKSFAIFLKNAPRGQAKLWMTGDGVWRDEAERLAKRLGIASEVEFLGMLPRAEVIDCYAKCHAVVFIPLDEPFGLVSCEAGMAGKPVIASDHGGPAETVTGHESGILVNPLDVKAIGQAMGWLLRDRVLCARMGKRGQERISREYGYSRFLDEFERVCAEVLKSQRDFEKNRIFAVPRKN